MLVYVVTRTEPTYCGCGCDTTHNIGVFTTRIEAERCVQNKCREEGRDDCYFNDGMWQYNYTIEAFVLG